MQIQKESTIGDIVAANFSTANIFDFYGIDFCCGGNKTLAEACEEKKLNVDELIEKLTKATGNGSSKGVNYIDWELDFLIDYIINNHHSYVIRTSPSIHQHALKVSEAHGANHPEVKQIAELFGEVKEELEGHMMKEERMLFPYIKNLVQAKRQNLPFDFPPFGSVENPIRVMEMEHDRAGEILSRIKELSNNYKLPEDACTTYTLLYKELKEYEDDLHTHIHLENNILFPKAIALEKTLNESFSNIS